MPPCGERCIDLSGATQPAPLASTDDVARAAAAVTQIVDAASLIVGQLQSGTAAKAAGSTTPKAAEACSEGGTRDVTTSGLSSARVEFDNCTENGVTLDGVLTLQCDQFDSNFQCVEGDMTFGENGDVLLASSDGPDFTGTALFRKRLHFVIDEATGELDLLLIDLEGEARNAQDQRASFLTDDLAVHITEQSPGVATVIVNGIAGFGGDTVEANCVSGTLNTATPMMLTVTDGDPDAVINSGHLDFTNTQSQSGSAVFDEGGISATTGSGASAVYTAAQLDDFCTIR